MHDGRMKTGTASAIGGAREDDEARAALDSFFRKYFHELVGMLRRRVRDPEEARDLVQTAFARVAARVEAPQALEEPRAYLMEVAKNVHIDRLRKETTRRTLEREARFLPAADEMDTNTPEEVVSQRQRLGELERLIVALPPMRRRIFILNRIHHLSLDEIADQEGMSRRAVRSHIERALADIRAVMGDTPRQRPSHSGDA